MSSAQEASLESRKEAFNARFNFLMNENTRLVALLLDSRSDSNRALKAQIREELLKINNETSTLLLSHETNPDLKKCESLCPADCKFQKTTGTKEIPATEEIKNDHVTHATEETEDDHATPGKRKAPSEFDGRKRIVSAMGATPRNPLRSDKDPEELRGNINWMKK